MENGDEEHGSTSGGALDGQVLAGRYRVARVVSAGANTVLIDAIDIETESPVTVKIVRPEHTVDPEFRRKFRHLAEISNALTHPNIASVTDWGEIELGGESTVFWTVDALGGGSLRDLLDRGRTLEPGQALVLGLEACRALDAAHQKGLFHTELTPSKMVFGADRRLRVVDFGMARLLAESAWVDVSAVPTHVARYASPEQALGLPIDAKTDVYALALVMIEAVSGSVPFAADSTVATLAGRVDRLLPVSADLGPLAAVLEHAGRPESADRFTAAEFGRALVQVAPRLPKPDPIPILASGQFDTTAMRRPTDPTGGVERPAPVPGLAAVGDAVVAAPAVAAAAVMATAANAGAAPGPELEGGPQSGVAPEADVELDAEAEVETGADEPASPVEPEPGIDAAIDEAGATEVIDGTTDDVDDLAEEPVTAVFAPVADVVVAPSSSESDPGNEAAEPAVEAPTVTATPPDLVDDDTDAETDDDVGDLRVADDDDDADDDADDLRIIEDEHDDDDDDLRIAGEVTTVSPVVVADPADDGTPAALYDDAPRRARGPIILLVALLVVGLGALGYAGSLLLQPKSFDVPVLAGTPKDEALNQIGGNDWDLTLERERSDSFPEIDMVIRTDPGPGTELQEGEPFLMVLSDGPEFRKLPDVTGLSFDAALTELASLGLIGIASDDREFSEAVPVDAVISWQVQGDADASMQAGAEILPGNTIVMTLSQGPEPRGVPDLAGQTVEEAIATLDAMQLGLSQGEDVFSEDVPAGAIVSQDPAAAALAERDSIVTVLVSKGPDRIEFPSLEGLLFDDAQKLLVDTGFTVGSLLGTTNGTFVEATVDGEAVAAGALFRRGQAIDLIFL